MLTRILVISLLFFPLPAFSKSENKITAQEVFLSLKLFEGEMEIIEYNLLANKTEKSDISKSVNKLKELVKTTEYLNYRYGFKNFTSIEENITNEGQYVKGTYKLVTSDKNIKNSITDVFSKVLNQEVKVELTDDHIKLFFDGSGVNIADNNALGVFGGKGNQRMIMWKNGTAKLDIVVNFKVEGRQPLVQYFDKSVTSPKKTTREIDNLKNSSPTTKVSLQAFQDDADIYRLRHMRYYGGLIEEYKKKTGKYPLQDSSKSTTYVFIAHDQQEEHANMMSKQNPSEHEIISFKDFVLDIESKLERKIDQYFDPQYEPDIKPNFYIYLIKGDTYFFAVNVSKYYEFSKKVTDNYYKIEISNSPTKNSKIWTYNDLVKNKSFAKDSAKEPLKESFFLEREKKYINYIQ